MVGILPKHGVVRGAFGFIQSEAKGQLFSEMVLVLPVPVHLVRTFLVGAEVVEQPFSDEFSKARHFQTIFEFTV